MPHRVVASTARFVGATGRAHARPAQARAADARSPDAPARAQGPTRSSTEGMARRRPRACYARTARYVQDRTFGDRDHEWPCAGVDPLIRYFENRIIGPRHGAIISAYSQTRDPQRPMDASINRSRSLGLRAPGN